MITINRWFDGQRYTSAIAMPARTLIHLVTIEETGVRVHSVPKQEERKLLPLVKGRQPYPLIRAVRKFRDCGRRYGITQHAKEILSAALDQERAHATDPPASAPVGAAGEVLP